MIRSLRRRFTALEVETLHGLTFRASYRFQILRFATARAAGIGAMLPECDKASIKIHPARYERPVVSRRHSTGCPIRVFPLVLQGSGYCRVLPSLLHFRLSVPSSLPKSGDHRATKDVYAFSNEFPRVCAAARVRLSKRSVLLCGSSSGAFGSRFSPGIAGPAVLQQQRHCYFAGGSPSPAGPGRMVSPGRGGGLPDA